MTAAARRLARLVAAQSLLLRAWAIVAVTLGFVALPVAALYLARAGVLAIQQLEAGFLQLDERYLPLWALVAGSVVWSDAEPDHRPLLFPWPVLSIELVLAKALAVGLGFAPLAGAAALGLPALHALATGATSALPPGLLLARSLVPGLVWLALATVGGAAGAPWAGLAGGAALWLLLLLPGPLPWLDRHTGGALNLFALTAGSNYALPAVNCRSILVAAGLLIMAWGILSWVRDGAPARFRAARGPAAPG